MRIALGRDLAAIKQELLREIDAVAELERMALADELPEQAQAQWQGRLAAIDVRRLRAKQAVTRAGNFQEARAAKQKFLNETPVQP